MSETLAKTSKSGTAEKTQLLNFFKQKEALRTPGYEGYEHIAQNLMRQLDYAAMRARSEDSTDRQRLVDLDLQPGADSYYYTEGKEKEGTQALITMAYRVTGAENNVIKHDVIHPVSGETPEDSVIILHGRYQGEDVYFIEQHKHGAVNIKLAAEVPDEFLRHSQIDEPKPFRTHGQRMEMWDQYFDSHEGSALPSGLSETEVIAHAVKHRKHKH
jgi:hypothetical protein